MMTPDFAGILRYSDTQWIAQEYAYYENGNTLDSICKSKLWFGVDELVLTLVLNFNNKIKPGSGYGQTEY
jgi:hypothetical protein